MSIKFPSIMAIAAIAMIAPAAAQEPSDRNWTTQCSAENRRSSLNCTMEQRVLLKETGRQIARFVLQVAGESRSPSLLIHVGLGLSVREGIKLQVDDTGPIALDIQACDAGGCYAGMPVDEKFLEQLQKGESAVVRFVNMQKNEIAVPITLAGFTATYADIK